MPNGTRFRINLSSQGKALPYQTNLQLKHWYLEKSPLGKQNPLPQDMIISLNVQKINSDLLPAKSTDRHLYIIHACKVFA